MDENQTVAGARSLKCFKSANQQFLCELRLWCFLTASLSCFLAKTVKQLLKTLIKRGN